MTKHIIATHNNTEHKLFIDERFQPRDVGDFDTKAIHEYSQLLQDGIEFPELEAVCWITDDGKHIYYLCSGFHRAEGYLAASQVNPNIKPLRFKVVHSDSDWNTLMQQAVIYGTASNKAHGVRISKSSYRRAIRKLYESGMDTKGITKALGVAKRTVERNTEDLRYETNKLAVSDTCRKLQMEPTASIAKLRAACNNVLGRQSLEALKALFNFAGESVCYQWLDAGRPTMSSGESIEDFYKFITGKSIIDTPSTSQLKETTNEIQKDTPTLPKTPMVSKKNTTGTPSGSERTPEVTTKKPTEDSCGVLSHPAPTIKSDMSLSTPVPTIKSDMSLLDSLSVTVEILESPEVSAMRKRIKELEAKYEPKETPQGISDDYLHLSNGAYIPDIPLEVLGRIKRNSYDDEEIERIENYLTTLPR